MAARVWACRMAPDSGGVETTMTVRARVQATFLLLRIERKVVRCARHCRFYHQAELRVILAQWFWLLLPTKVARHLFLYLKKI